MLLLAMIAALTQWDWTPPAPRAPMPPANTWDGVAGFDEIVTDPETGQITFPMDRRPADAVTRGCVFGLSNVRCPAPDDDADFGRLAESMRLQAERTGRIAFDVDLDQAVAQPDARVDCVIETPQAGQRRCTFDEALNNSYVDDREREAEQAAREAEDPFAWLDDPDALSRKPETPATGRLGFATGRANQRDQEPEPEQPAQRERCRREEYRSPDGSTSSFRFVCGSGDQRLMDDVMERLGPN